MIEIKLAGVPVGKGRPRFVKSTGRAFTPEKTVRFEDRLSIVAQEAMAGRAPFDGPLAVEVEIRMPAPISKPKRWRDRALAGLIRPTKKPDADNFAKMLDACNMIVWVDDSQIVDLHVTKFYHEAPAFIARVREVGADELKALDDFTHHAAALQNMIDVLENAGLFEQAATARGALLAFKREHLAPETKGVFA